MTGGWFKDRSGNTAMLFAVITPVLMTAAGVAIDYGRLAHARTELQAAADIAALAAARELRLAGRQDAAVKAVAHDIAAAELDHRPFAFSATINAAHDRLTVQLGLEVDTYLLPASDAYAITATAEAMVEGGAPVCLLSLVGSGRGAVTVADAGVVANGCAVYSNSQDAQGIEVVKNGAIQADLICSSGGVGLASGTVKPKPTLDCPPAADPIAARPMPPVGSCDYTDHAAVGVAILHPGTYCGGLTVKAGSVATFLPGDYVIKDGPLTFSDFSIVSGLGVGFFLTGSGAVFAIDSKTSVRLIAPVSGPLAGMLFFEDRGNTPGTHRIASRDAPVLLGTIYLPVSALEVGNPEGLGLLQDVLGALSAWTIVVARKVSVHEGLKLTLNSDYGATTVPVPVGFGPDAFVSLTR